MKTLAIASLGGGLLLPIAGAAAAADRGDRVEWRLATRGDRIDQRLDRRGDGTSITARIAGTERA